MISRRNSYWWKFLLAEIHFSDYFCYDNMFYRTDTEVFQKRISIAEHKMQKILVPKVIEVCNSEFVMRKHRKWFFK